MAESEERPSKIRKLDISEDPKETISFPKPAVEMNGQAQPSPPAQEKERKEKPDQTEETPAISKSQLKKLKKKAEWDAGREYRKAKRREQHKAKQARKAEARQETQAKIASGEVEDATKGLPFKKQAKRPVQVPVTFILDCDFERYMQEKEIISLGAQVTRCYSDNKANPYRAHIVVSSWGGALKERFETVLSSNHLGWKGVRFMEGDFMEAAAQLDGIMRSSEGGKLVGALAGEGEGTSEVKRSNQEPVEEGSAVVMPQLPTEILTSTSGSAAENGAETEQEPFTGTDSTSKPSIIYLSSDSPHTLDRLSPNTSYIVGGIVDKNRHKGLCYKRACERGIRTAKLPIGEYMTMQSRTVLAVNHVVEIMLKWLETGDWGDAFLSVIPKRKEARLKVQGKGSVDESVDDEDGGRELEEASQGGEIDEDSKLDIDENSMDSKVASVDAPYIIEEIA